MSTAFQSPNCLIGTVYELYNLIATIVMSYIVPDPIAE